MSTIRILVIGRNKDILSTVVRLIDSNNEWQATGVQTDEEAMDAANNCSFDLVLLTNGIDTTSERLLKNHFNTFQPGALLVQHYGGGSGLLSNEIMHALKVKNDYLE